MQRPLVDNHVDFVATALLIVDGVMLDVADHMLRLLALDAIAYQGSRQNGIFAEVLEGASIARLASDVGAAAEGHVIALCTQLASNQSAVCTRGLRVPA